MTNDAPVARRQVEILNALGLHLRPADKFVRLADRLRVGREGPLQRQRVQRQEHPGPDGLGAEQGTVLELEARGPDAEAAVAPWPSWCWRGSTRTTKARTQDPAP